MSWESISRLADLTGYHRSTVTAKVRHLECRQMAQEKRYDSVEALAAIYGNDQANQALDLNVERARLVKEQADGQALRNRLASGEVVHAMDVQMKLTSVAEQIGAVLDALPQKVKRRVPHLTAAEVTIIKTEVVKAQNIAAKVVA